ncbi:MAG: hypothetical protein RR743_03410, partial [Oscillospiraceae bacterium]
ARQKYCKDCAVEAVKKVDRPMSKKWNSDHKEEYYPTKNEKRRVIKCCKVCGNEMLEPGTAVICSPECAKVLRSYNQGMADYKRGKRKSLPKPYKDGMQEDVK